MPCRGVGMCILRSFSTPHPAAAFHLFSRDAPLDDMAWSCLLDDISRWSLPLPLPKKNLPPAATRVSATSLVPEDYATTQSPPGPCCWRRTDRTLEHRSRLLQTAIPHS